MREYFNRSTIYFRSHPGTLLLGLLFVFHIFFRFYGFEDKHGFAWDQVDNAWAAKNIIVEHKFPLVGMVAKQNSGFYIGPLYYYYVAFFYFLTNLDPVASVFIAGVTSIIGFFILYVFTRKIFSEQIALVAVFFHTFSSFVITADRVQWPVNFLATISIVIFYVLYKIATGNEKFILYLAILLGLSWQLNFTSIFFFIISLFVLPLFPRTRKSLKNLFLFIPILFLFLLPNVIFDLQNRATSLNHLNSYINSYYHGFHFLRMLQLAKDAFIEYASILNYPILNVLRYAFIPLFLFVYLFKSHTHGKIVLSYLVLLWFLVPWIVFSVYKGEISNYYFSLTRPITLILISYLIICFYNRNYVLAKLLVGLSLVVFAVINIRQFFIPSYRPLSYHRNVVMGKMNNGEIIEFSSYDPESYLYYVFTKNAKGQKNL